MTAGAIPSTIPGEPPRAVLRRVELATREREPAAPVEPESKPEDRRDLGAEGELRVALEAWL